MESPTAARWHLPVRVLASAVLLGLCARGGLAWVLAFVALVPWLLALQEGRGLRHALWAGWLMSVAFVAAVFHWFGAAIGAYTGIGGVVATTVLLVLAPLLQPQFIAYAVVRTLARRRHGPATAALAAAAAWAACESLLPRLLGDSLGHALYPSMLLRQAADLGGAAGLALLVLLVNEAVALAWCRRRDGTRRMLAALVPALGIVLALAGYGALRLATLPAPSADVAAIRVAMVQASITDYEGMRREIGAHAVVRHVLDTHYALSWSALRDHQADALLWSETVYPTPFGHPRSELGAELDREIQGFVDSAGVPLVFGTYDVDGAGEYNAAAFLEPGQGLLGYYRKTHPFPLTEYVPAWLDGPRFRRWVPWAGGWRPGHGARVLPLRTVDGREVDVLPLICLDDVRPQLALDGVRLGAQAIIGLSNDSWFSDFPVGADLHLRVAAFRSIETRLPQLRVTTNGMSALIDPTGAVLARTGMGDQAVLTGVIAAHDPPPTLMVRWGDWVGRVALVVLFGFALGPLWRRMRARAEAGAAADANGPWRTRVVLLSPLLRAVLMLLQVVVALGLLWLALGMLRNGPGVHSLAQLSWFGWSIVLPATLAWALQWACRAEARIEGGLLVLVQPHRRTEVPLASLAILRPWRLPLPAGGVDLGLASGARWRQGIVVADPARMQVVLVAAGAATRMDDGWAARLASLRATAPPHWLDHPLLKFVLFPLLPALLAFRLHQVITFGGAFGELQVFGAGAWLLGLGIWWASWALGLVLFAALLRLLQEAIVLCLVPWARTPAQHLPRVLRWGARLVYYVGVPAWLLLRMLGG